MRKPVLLLLLGLAALQTSAHAADNNRGRNLAANCATCHGTNGVSAGGLPSLAGMSKRELIEEMQELKSSNKSGRVMVQHAKGYSDQDIELIAEFFAAQK